MHLTIKSDKTGAYEKNNSLSIFTVDIDELQPES